MSTLRSLALLLPSVVFAGGCVSEARGGWTPPPGEFDPPDGVVDYAILYFDYDGTDELAQLRKGFAQMLIADTAQGTEYRVVERARIQEVMNELKLNATTVIDKQTAQQIGKAVGADRMVLGGYQNVLGTFVVTVGIVDVERIAYGCTMNIRGKAADFVDFEQQIATWLRGAMLIGGMDKPNCPARPPEVVESSVVPVGAVVKYSQALDAKDNHQPEQAKVILEELVKEEPDFKLAHDELVTLTK